MEPYDLPDWIYITVTRDGDSKYLTVYSRIHVNKEVIVGPSYSLEWSDQAVIKELSGRIYSGFIA